MNERQAEWLIWGSLLMGYDFFGSLTVEEEGLGKKKHATPSERDQHSVAASGQTVLCNNHQGLGKWQQGRCKHWVSALGHSGQGTKAGICWGFERSFWARFQLLLSPTHSWVPSWSPVRSRVLFRVTSFMPLLAPLAWQSAFPCSDNMEECVLNQAQTCLLGWKHSMMSMANPFSQIMQTCTSPDFPKRIQRGYVWKISKKSTLEACRGILWTECKQCGSHQSSILFIPLSTTRCSMHSA